MPKRTLLSCLAVALLLPSATARADGPGQVLVDKGLVSQEALDGAELFFRGTFSGNGRTCGTCHPVDNNLTIDPEFISTLPPDDPLFTFDLPPDDGFLEREDLLAPFGLILENVDLDFFDGVPDMPRVDFVMRSVPHTLSLSTSIDSADELAEPQATGWSADGSPDGTLLGFSTGAVAQHFTTSLDRVVGQDFVLPTPQELAAMETYMLSVGRMADLDIDSLTFADAAGERGRDLFLNIDDFPALPGQEAFTGGKCRFCHNNAGADIADQNFNRDTGVEAVVTPARLAATFPIDDGHGSGTEADGRFNVPPLVEAADTGPFFHNNAFDTIEEAVGFYSSDTFNGSPAGLDLSGEGIHLAPGGKEDIAAFLRVVNAAFNIAIAKQRTDAAALVVTKPRPIPCIWGLPCPPPPPEPNEVTITTLLALANVEAQDAVDVLSERSLGAAALVELDLALDLNQQAIAEQDANARKLLIVSAAQHLESAGAALGGGLDFQLGAGNLLF